MRVAELAAYEALKEDHREPTALWAALVHKAVAAVLPIHEQQVRERVAAELDGRAHDAAVCHVNGPTCLEAVTLTQAAWAVRKGT